MSSGPKISALYSGQTLICHCIYEIHRALAPFHSVSSAWLRKNFGSLRLRFSDGAFLPIPPILAVEEIPSCDLLVIQWDVKSSSRDSPSLSSPIDPLRVAIGTLSQDDHRLHNISIAYDAELIQIKDYSYISRSRVVSVALFNAILVPVPSNPGHSGGAIICEQSRDLVGLIHGHSATLGGTIAAIVPPHLRVRFRHDLTSSSC